MGMVELFPREEEGGEEGRALPEKYLFFRQLHIFPSSPPWLFPSFYFHLAEWEEGPSMRTGRHGCVEDCRTGM